MAITLNDNVLVALDDVKTWLRIDLGDTSLDDLVKGFMNAVAQKFENFCSREFKLKERTEVYNGQGSDNIMVKNYPIQSITSIAFSTSVPRDFSDALSAGYYEIDEVADRETINFIGRRIPMGKNVIQVVYQGGYSTYPDDLALSFKQAVEFFYRGRDRQDVGTDRIQKGDEGYNKSKVGISGLPESIEASIKPYVSMAQMNILGARAD